MKCDPIRVGDSELIPGGHFYRCTRRGCKRKAHNIYTLDRIDWQAECLGIPHNREVLLWLEMVAESWLLAWVVAIFRKPRSNLVIHHPLAEGPGTELKKMFDGMGVYRGSDNACDAWIFKMNGWGPEGCREHRDEILTHLRTQYDEASVLAKARAWGNAKIQGLPLTLDGLLDLAIERTLPTPNQLAQLVDNRS